MEKRKEIQEKAFYVLFKIFNDYNHDFTLDFWKEILNQIILPLLEDIHLAVEIPNKKYLYPIFLIYIFIAMTANFTNRQFKIY